jgi:hypothetical protein
MAENAASKLWSRPPLAAPMPPPSGKVMATSREGTLCVRGDDHSGFGCGGCGNTTVYSSMLE